MNVNTQTTQYWTPNANVYLGAPTYVERPGTTSQNGGIEDGGVLLVTGFDSTSMRGSNPRPPNY